LHAVKASKNKQKLVEAVYLGQHVVKIEKLLYQLQLLK